MSLRNVWQVVRRIGRAFRPIGVRVSAMALCLLLSSGGVRGDTVAAAAGIGVIQVNDSTWNGARALSLMELARDRRMLPQADTALDNYQGRAEGLVYFYLDRRDVDERVLIRTDQVALEVYWAQPDQARQRIVGLRDESSLPNRMHYHLDHLTIVQNGFGDVMRMGDGDEVRDVPHPAAPGSGAIYDFRLADSLTLQLPGAPEPIKAYRIEVRPKEPDQPAFVGALYVDHAGGDIVRMTFTFTPVSYVDPRLDYINVSLDNSLWRGRYWLPYEQAVEIRRQVPQLDFVVSSVIQARFRVTDYEFNVELPDNLFWGYRVVTVPLAQREAYEFDRAIYEDLHDAGLSPPPELQDIRATAARLIRNQTLSGLPRLRLSLPNASAAFRYNRAEGVYIGWGSSFRPADAWRVEAVAGYAFGAAHAPLRLGIVSDPGTGGRIRLDAYHRRVRDIGIRPGAAGVFNTLAAAAGDDYLDPYYASGATVSFERPVGTRSRIGLEVAFEEHRNASLEATTPPLGDGAFRPVREVANGTAFTGRISVERPAVETTRLSFGGGISIEAGLFESGFYASPAIRLDATRGSADRRALVTAGVIAGAVLGSPAPQHLFLAGGRRTMPGYAYRSFAGDAFAIVRLEAARDLFFPFVRARLAVTGGWTDTVGHDPTFGQETRVPGSWATTPTDGLRTSIGAGLGLGWDVLRLDLVRGLDRGGEWQFLVSIDPRFWPIL